MDPGSKTASSTTETSRMGANSSTQSPVQNVSSDNSTPHESATMPVVDDDSDSDVSMSAETDDEEESTSTPIIQMHDEVPPKEHYPLASSNPNPEVSKKRKLSDSMECMSDDHGENGMSREVTKRLKPDDAYQQFRTPDGHLCQDRSLLPAEIWQHIFTFTPPRVLGQLLQVNKKFHTYLDSSSSANHVIPLPRSCTQVLKPEAIWQASRRLFRPNQPLPLNGMSEVEMWRLACCVSCQFCGKKRQPSHMPQMDQWHPGPGQSGVIPIWSFSVRTCGPCLEQRTIKHIDLLTSPTFEEKLMGALPFVFLTNELHIIPPTTLQKAGSPPSTIQIDKQFLQTMTDAINQEYIDVSAKMGAATAQEWLKGLDERGKEQRNDAARWERWEASGGVSRMRRNEPHEAQKFILESAIPPLASIASLPAAPPSAKSSIPNLSHSSQYYQLPQPIHTAFPNPPARYDSPSQNGFSPHPSRSQPQARHERTKEEVAEMKAARRTEIERRCVLLDPPLTPGVLAHMSSYQAAIQIIQPLTDQAWEVLKPRLLSQRGEAEQREKDRIAQTRVVQERFDASRWQGAKTEDSKEVIEREWEDVQAPLRTRIGGYADEIIRDGWNGGTKVTRENCTSFAAEVLVYVRKRFYAEIAKDEAASRATGQTPAVDPPNGPYTRKLILENMKWLFDTKIKPITEQYRKELFLCNDCDGNFKYYGFEGVIQHFAAKHTTALSLGSVVVHWKSEWPEYPPFKPDPNAASHSYYNVAPSASDPYGQTMQQTYGYNGYHQPGPVSAPMQPQNPHAYQESPAPYYGHPQYGDQYTGHQNGPFAPPPPQQSYIDPSQSYPEMQYSAPPSHSNVHGYSQGPQDYSQQAYAAHYPVPPQGNYESPHPSQAYPASVPDTVGQQPAYYPQGNGYGPGYHQPPVFQNAKPQQASNSTRPPQTAEYKSQLLDVAAAARDVWKALNGVKEVPGSVKVYTIIYHILKKSRAKYQNDPPLSMISDGLNNNKDMRQVRNVNGLLCRACVLGMAGSAGQQKKHFSLPQLVNHFHSVHEIAVSENGLGHVPDWTQDMVELPDTTKLSAVARAPGMDDSKLSLFAEALPQIVAKPVSNANEEEYPEHLPAYEPNTMRGTYDPPPSQDNHDKYYKSTGNARPSDIESNNYPNAPDKQGCHEERSARGIVARRGVENRQRIYEDPPSRHYVEQGAIPVQVRTIDDRERHVVREDAPLYTDRATRYRAVEHRGRASYDPAEPALSNVDYRQANSQPYRPNAEDLPTAMARIAEQQKLSFASRDVQLQNSDPSAPRHKPITEVITELARATKVKKEPLDAGSEDGELPAEPGSRPAADDVQLGDEADRAAERFLNEFLPNNPQDEQKRPQEIARRREDERRSQWDADHGVRRVYQPTPDSQRRMREGYENDGRFMAGRPVSQVNDGYVLHERLAPQTRQIRSYEDPYGETLPTQALPRERSPELVDRRFKLNNVVYREDRQSSQGMHRTPSRYARYESVRLENDRARSRSPVYVKMGAPPGQYRDRSPVPHSLQQEPVYRRSPPGPPEEIAYERAPRQEYYRVYADEPRQRQPAPQYAEAFEYVQVSDPDGDYMIRRPVRREPEPIYIDRATYEDEVYGRQPVYESHRAAPMSRSDPAYYEEYDPRHPAPPPPARQVRYE